MTSPLGPRPPRSFGAGLRSHLRQKAWPLITSLALVVSGMAYSVLWPMVVRHSHLHYWLIPTDYWFTVRDAHYVAWGALPYIYGTHSALVTLPGLPLLLAPVAALSSALHLTESYGPWVVARPSGWLLEGPIMLMLGSSLVFACDSWFAELEVGPMRRRLGLFVVAAVSWDMVARWGHPEDALALAAAFYCLLAVRRERWRSAGWWLGVAVCFQPLVFLFLPAVLAAAGRRRALPLLVRGSFLPAVLLAAVLAIDAKDVVRSVVQQPNYPLLDQPTPWSHLSPAMSDHAIGAGPSRLVALAVAVALGGLAWRWRHDWTRLLWIGGAMLATRGVFEAVMVPYYVTPALVLGVLVASTRLPYWRMAAAFAAAGLTIYQFNTRSASLWTWWLESAGALVLTMALASPFPGLRRGGPEPIEPVAGECPVGLQPEPLEELRVGAGAFTSGL